MLFQEKDNSFTEWIDNREVDKGNYEENGDNIYRLKSEKQDFEIILKDDNSFEIIIKQVDEGRPIVLKNISTDDVTTSFEGYDDIDEYKTLLD